MKQICVIGVGYVGLVTAACFADLGNRVIAVDVVEDKIEGLKRGEMPIYEPGLKELVERNVLSGRLSFTTSYEEGMEGTEFVFIAVGTPRVWMVKPTWATSRRWRRRSRKPCAIP